MRDTIDELLAHRAATDAAKPAVIDPVDRITYAALGFHHAGRLLPRSSRRASARAAGSG